MTAFGRYTLLRRLAVGGMAEIFLARSSSIDGFEKMLVIKRIRSDLSSNERFYSMFIDEARLSIAFTHPNVVQVFDFGKIDDSYYLAMELINGCDLGTIIELDGVAGRGLDPGLALLIIGDVCQGLDYAHNQTDTQGNPLGIVHRDVSPANIMLGYSGAVKIADFGIAEARGRMTETQPGVVIGKLSYMSPEQANGLGLDRRSDLFSTGMVLWEALTGQSGYGDTIEDDFFERIATAQIAPPSTVRPDLPPELDALVMRALAPRPEDRYSTARDLGEAIRRFRVANYPEASAYDLQAFLQQHRQALRAVIARAAEVGTTDNGDASAEQAPPAPVVVQAPQAPSPPPQSDGFDWSPELIDAVESFRRRPSLWILVEMGRICERENNPGAADLFWGAAAAKFAQAGLLAQALLCCKLRLRWHGFEALRAQLAHLPLLPGAEDDEVTEALAMGEGPVQGLILELLSEGIKAGAKPSSGTPLLSYLGGEAFAAFADQARLMRFGEGQTVVAQGDTGRTMYLIVQGRVLVHAIGHEGERIYLSSLTSGDFFGENSFFSGAPRSATVEALYDVDAFEIDRALYDRVMQHNPQASYVLLRFYKERIVETLLARSPIFSKLPAEDRRALLPAFNLREFPRGATIIKEGDINDQIYLIKNGDAEVFTEKGGPRTTLSTIGPGTVFGEVAALRGVPRTATVVATTALETLELSGKAFHDVLDAKPDIRTKILDVVAQRARENMDKVMGPSPFARNLPTS